jgi:hypothetical protein
MAILVETSALENMPVTDGNLHIVDLLQASKLILSDIADELRQAIAEDYDGFDMHAELERVLDLPFILEGPSFAVSTTWDDLTADD